MEELRWAPRCRSMGSNSDAPRRNRVAGLDMSVDGKREAKEAKSRCLVVEGGGVVSLEVDVDGKGVGDAAGIPALSGAIFVWLRWCWSNLEERVMAESVVEPVTLKLLTELEVRSAEVLVRFNVDELADELGQH